MTVSDQFGDEAGRRVRLLASDLSTKALARAPGRRLQGGSPGRTCRATCR